MPVYTLTLSDEFVRLFMIENQLFAETTRPISSVPNDRLVWTLFQQLKDDQVTSQYPDWSTSNGFKDGSIAIEPVK